MKIKASVAGLAAVGLLALSVSLQAAITNKVTVQFSPPAAGGVIANDGAGSYASGSSVTVTAVNTNDCYQFVDWMIGVKKITNNPYTFTVSNNETLTANFQLLQFTIAAAVSPTNGGTISGAGKKGCDTTVTLLATAKPGFAFTDWTLPDAPGFTDTNNPYKFRVGGSNTLVAHFRDKQPPKLTILFPTVNEKVPTAAFTLEGTASDNVAVANVYYNLNGTGWTNASEVNNFTPWYAFVTLKPDSVNTLSVYAVDTSGNATTNHINFSCTAAGLAPLSIAGQLSEEVAGTNGNDYSTLSFDSAGYVRVGAGTNIGAGAVGTYTYTPTGPNTAELVEHRVFPTVSTNDATFELFFTDAYTAPYTDNSGGSGYFFFAAAEQSVPASLDGLVAVSSSLLDTNRFSTNMFDNWTFTEMDNSGGSNAGTYTFAKFTPVGALVVETYTSPASMIGTTGYTVLAFTEGASPAAGVYFFESLDASNIVQTDIGNFTTSSNRVTTKFLGPVTLDGWQATITPDHAVSFIRSFGNGTYASTFLTSLASNEPVDVGLVLVNPRVTTNTGIVELLGLAPPYAAGQDETANLIWKTSSSTHYTATFTLEGSSVTGKLSYSPLPAKYAPAAVSGQTITTHPTGNGKSATYSFAYNVVTAGGANVGEVGTYTYAPYSPTMALVTLTLTNTATAGESQYALLNYVSSSSGSFVSSRMSAGSWIYRSGSFTQAPTK